MPGARAGEPERGDHVTAGQVLGVVSFFLARDLVRRVQGDDVDLVDKVKERKEDKGAGWHGGDHGGRHGLALDRVCQFLGL
jgi:hypothetical protein